MQDCGISWWRYHSLALSHRDEVYIYVCIWNFHRPMKMVQFKIKYKWSNPSKHSHFHQNIQNELIPHSLRMRVKYGKFHIKSNVCVHNLRQALHSCFEYHQIVSISHTKSPNLNVSHLVLQLSLPNPFSQVLIWQWRWSWSSTNRQWVMDNLITSQGAFYVRGLIMIYHSNCIMMGLFCTFLGVYPIGDIFMGDNWW